MGLPIRNFDPATVTAVNEAKLFQAFDLATLHWREADTDEQGRAAREAVGLALRIQPKAGQPAVTVVPTHLGPLTCIPLRSDEGDLVEQRLLVELPAAEARRLRPDPATNVGFDCRGLRVVYGLAPALAARLKTQLEAHLGAGRLEPAQGSGDLGNTFQLAAWLDGTSSIPWRFANGVARNDATLLTLQPGETLKVFVEAGLTVPGRTGLVWYRVNPGFVLGRLVEAGETAAHYDFLAQGYVVPGVANGRQAAYETMEGSLAGGVLAPPHPVPRTDLVAITGGSMPSTVLEPVGVVPPSLFSFVTSDQVTVYDPRLTGPDPGPWLRIRCSQPTLTRGDVTSVWPTVRFRATALPVFRTTELAHQLEFNQLPGRPPDLEDALGELIGYGLAGFESGYESATGHLVRFVPHAEQTSRPSHPPFKPKLTDEAAAAALASGNPLPDYRNQLRQLYPLRYTLVPLADEHTDREFTVTQDETDCVRQEYVFHMNWDKDSLGTPRYFQQAQAGLQGDVAAEGPVETVVGGKPVPRCGAVNIIARSDFRPLGVGEYNPIVPGARPRYRNVTPAPGAWRTIYDNRIVPGYETHLDAITRVVAGIGLPAGMPRVYERFVAFLQAMPPGQVSSNDPVRDYLYSLDALRTALDSLAVPNNKRLQINSFWRPPEHNETVSELRSSPHQDMRGFDIQQAGGRSALNLLAVHHAGEQILSAANSPLSQVLLEHRSRLFVSAGYDNAHAEKVVARAGNKYLLVTPTGDIDLNAFWGASPMGEDEVLPGRGVPGIKLLDDFRQGFTVFMTAAGRSPEWPNPTVDRMYYYALAGASHVHFTLRT